MPLELKKLFSATAIHAVLTAAPVAAQDYGADWDMDVDGALSGSEFAEGFAERGIFDSWDADSDGLLSDTVDFHPEVTRVFHRELTHL